MPDFPPVDCFAVFSFSATYIVKAMRKIRGLSSILKHPTHHGYLIYMNNSYPPAITILRESPPPYSQQVHMKNVFGLTCWIVGQLRETTAALARCEAV